MWLHWQGSNSWQVDAAVLPTNVSIPGFFFFFLSVCCWSLTFLADPVQSQPSPVSPLTCFFQFWPFPFFFFSSDWSHLALTSLSPPLSSPFPLSRLLSPPQGHFSFLKVAFPPPQGRFLPSGIKFSIPPPCGSIFFPSHPDFFFTYNFLFPRSLASLSHQHQHAQSCLSEWVVLTPFFILFILFVLTNPEPPTRFSFFRVCVQTSPILPPWVRKCPVQGHFLSVSQPVPLTAPLAHMAMPHPPNVAPLPPAL